MKKHLIAILIIVLVLSLSGVGVWLFMRNRNIKPLYKANCEFVLSKDTEDLKTKIKEAEDLYTVSGETRLTTLCEVIDKLDTFEQDLNCYLMLSKAKPKTTKNLSKSYTSLNKSRSTLLKEYDEYIVRMSGNLSADGNAVDNLYNQLFNKTVSYIYKYNECFSSTSSYVFSKVYNAGNIKSELYSLYALGVNNLLNNISNNRFASTALIDKLNDKIKLVDGNVLIKSSVIGGEFSEMALKFKTHFNRSDKSVLIGNFITYYNANVNVDIETSNEKLAVYYAKQLLEI